jgi:PII-like signaling protein
MNQIDKLKEFKQLLQDISDADNKHIMTMEAVNVIRSFI